MTPLSKSVAAVIDSLETAGPVPKPRIERPDPAFVFGVEGIRFAIQELGGGQWSTSTIKRWLKAEKIPATKFGGQWRARVAALSSWIISDEPI